MAVERSERLNNQIVDLALIRELTVGLISMQLKVLSCQENRSVITAWPWAMPRLLGAVTLVYIEFRLCLVQYL